MIIMIIMMMMVVMKLIFILPILHPCVDEEPELLFPILTSL